MRSEFEEKQAELKAQFEAKIDEIKRKSAEELNNTKAEMIARLKRDYGKNFLASYTVNLKKLFNFIFVNVESNYEKFKADKEEEQQDIQRNYKRKLSDADVKMR